MVDTAGIPTAKLGSETTKNKNNIAQNAMSTQRMIFNSGAQPNEQTLDHRVELFLALTSVRDLNAQTNRSDTLFLSESLCHRNTILPQCSIELVARLDYPQSIWGSYMRGIFVYYKKLVVLYIKIIRKTAKQLLFH